jgi:TonB family protein
VNQVRTETAKLVNRGGKLSEGPRQLMELTTYDAAGNRFETSYYLVSGSMPTGKEEYEYDDKGNIKGMTLRAADGSILGKESYQSEFDAVGNWTKMTTSVAILEGGKVTFEPTEVTYRAIAYYMEEATVNKLSQPAASSAASSAASPVASSANSAPPANVPTAQPANVRTASASSASPTPAITTTATSVSAPKGNAFVPAASTPGGSSNVSPNVSTANGKKSSAVVALPELAAVDNKVYAVTNPSVGNARSAVESGGGSNNAPQVKVEGEAPARPLAKGPLKPISGGVLNGKALSLPAPFYPEIAKRMRAAGVVSVEVVIDVTGRVISAKATGGSEVLQQSAEKAAMQARFSPTLLSGQPVKISGIINYNFSLEK